MSGAAESLEQLREGNERFVAGRSTLTVADVERIGSAAAQQPFAVILGCSDSRVPTEVIFDQGPGRLFVIRVAGNIVQTSQIGSVEFAATKFGTRLVVVLGHTHCGAVEATADLLMRPGDELSPGIAAIVDGVRPSVEPLLGGGDNREALVQKAVRANVESGVGALCRGSKIIEALVDRGALFVVGAVYDLETGVVDFFDVAGLVANGGRPH